ncbi:MAG: sulfate adenylyltransferase [Myxococcales bacterium]|nr:sulfate adenylyltransferase [Myxococcales bacterium]
MDDLVPVHGGLAEPVDRIVSLREGARFRGEANARPRVVASAADVSTLYRIADGTLSPLRGPMDEGQWSEVLETESLERDGVRYAWTIPIALPASDSEVAALQGGSELAVVSERGELFALLDDVTVYRWDKAKYLRSVYGTERTDHPGAKMVLDDARDQLIGGRVTALPQRHNPAFGSFVLSPRMTRALIRDRKWQRALAFQTRNPLHRAHEYALVAGAERLTREGSFTGVVLNPLVGELKGDDVPAVVRMRCYRELQEKRLLGHGDVDPELWRKAGYALHDVFELIALDMKMFYAGPKEAVMHAIYRQNHGFSDIVIGRKHADAPFDDGTPIWGDFDAQKIFEELDASLVIRPCNIGFAAYYESLGRVDLTELHPDEKPVTVSGSEVRAQLAQGELPDPRILRPEIAAILIAAS